MLKDTLESIFGYDDFKNSTQQEATIAIHKGERDVFVRTPPGSGKSLCFQLPAVLKKDKVAIVFSPNLALIKNQIDFLREKGIRACPYTFMSSYDERYEIKNDLQSDSPKIKLVYITPEMAALDDFQDIIRCIRREKLSYFIIDEAHCVSELADDFRPSCGELGVFRKMHPDIPVIALTATAIPEIQDHIFKKLHMRDVLIISPVLPVFRPNIFYDVWFLETLNEPIIHLKNFIEDTLSPLDNSIPMYNRNCGIIYCRTKDVTDTIALQLTEAGIPTFPYHSEWDDETRNQVQDLWMTGNLCVIAATIESFGLGIDKKFVRFVVHWTVPKSIAAYCRQSGRAGRDGNKAHCRIYFSKEEVNAIRHVLPDKQMPRFEDMITYCLQANCRHAAVAEYLQDVPPLCENRCDVCVNKVEVQERIAQYQQPFISLDKEIIQDQEILQHRLQRLTTNIFTTKATIDFLKNNTDDSF